jgi:hypothetical protein
VVNLSSDAAHVKHNWTVEIGSSDTNSVCLQEDHSEFNAKREYRMPVRCFLLIESVKYKNMFVSTVSQSVFPKICYCSQKTATNCSIWCCSLLRSI